jgi:protein-S-isoprenylcysteine O-methyltransferase Ste14
MKLGRSILYCFATVIIYLGVALVGWGLGGMSQFFSSAPRVGYAIVVVLFGLGVGIQSYESTEGIRGKSGEAEKLVVRQTVVRYVLELSLYAAMLLIPYFDRYGIGVFSDSTLLRWLGVGLSLVGYGLIYWSGVALGRQYSADVTIQENHHLITDSIYRFIRHPRYLGIMALALGISCVFRTWIGLAASIFFLALLLYRIKDEEATVHAEFGAEWDAYCSRSWCLIPLVF